MRQNGAPVKSLALIAGLLLVVGIAGADIARAAETARQPWLGVYMQEMTSELHEGFDYDGPGGVIVSRVVGDSPAEQAGLRRDDVIVRVDGRLMDTPAELTEWVRQARVGQRIKVQVFRDGDYRTFDVTLGTRPRTTVEEEYRLELPEAPATPKAPARPKKVERRIVVKDLDDLENLEGLQGLEVLRDLPGGARGLFAMAGRGRLGVRVESLSPALGDYFGLKDGKGALVMEVLDETPAQRAGFLAGDVITRVDDQAVTNSLDLVKALRGKEGKVALRVVRHGTPRTIEATLDKPGATWVERPEDPSGSSPEVRKRILLRTREREDLRHELDQMKQQLEEMRQRLEQESEEGDE